MKITRQDIMERYNTTADWLQDFDRNMGKKADFLSNIKTIMHKRKDFATIEEKMADIRQRAGFGLIKETSEEMSDVNVKSAAECTCGTCPRCKGALLEHDSDNKAAHAEILDVQRESLDTLKMILKYIESFISDRSSISYDGILAHCREHPKLGFDKIEKKIDHTKFRDLVNKLLNKHKNRAEEVEYVPEAESHSTHDHDLADYVRHALPEG